MSTNTTNMAMGKAVDGDNAKTYLETTLGAALDKIDAHDHSGTTKGLTTLTGLTSVVIASGGLTVTAGGITSNGDNQIFKAVTTTTATLLVRPFDDLNTATSVLAVTNTAGSSNVWAVTKAGSVTQAQSLTVTAGGLTVTAGGLILGGTTPSAAAGQVAFSGQVHATASAGGGTLPATPAAFLLINVAGTVCKIPYYLA